MARILDICFLILTKIFLFKYRAFSSFYIKKKEGKGILALPYYPKGFPGGSDRIANWKKQYEARHRVFDVFWASDTNELSKLYGNGTNLSRYLFYFKILFRRVRIIGMLKQYEVIWIQRAFIPYYPYEKAYFETLLFKLHPKVILDYYDADYIHTPNLIKEAAKGAYKISVSTPFLASYFSTFNDRVSVLNMTIDPTSYVPRSNKSKKDITIGWMGSKGNSIHLKKLEAFLITLEKEIPQLHFHFVGPKDLNLKLERLHVAHWNDPGFDYFKWFSGIDIGLVPYFGEGEADVAKSPKKTLEFMASDIPIIANKNGAYDGMEHKKHFMLAESEEEWYQAVKSLIENQTLRDHLSSNALTYFNQNHTYRANFDRLEGILS